jgi:hypothetical protein
MKINLIRMLVPVLLILMIAGCTGIRISTDFDKQVDFSKYKTFNFSKEVNKLTLNDLNRRRLKDAITREMVAKGYQISTTPDLLVSAFVVGQAVYSANANSNYFGGMYYGGWGSSNTYVDVNKSIEGTLFIDLIDVQEKKMVWEGIAEGLVNPRTKTREETINSVVGNIFKNFPH